MQPTRKTRVKRLKKSEKITRMLLEAYRVKNILKQEPDRLENHKNKTTILL